MRHCLPPGGIRTAFPGGQDSRIEDAPENGSGNGSGSKSRTQARTQSGTKPRSGMDRQNRAAAAARKCALKTVAGIALLAVVSSPVTRAWGESANADYKRGEQAEARQDYDTALDDYEKAAQRNPRDLRYRAALDRIRTTASNYHL